MPVMDGMGFLLEKAKYDELKSVPVVVISSFIDEKLAKELLEKGVSKVIKKPFTEEGFLAVYDTYCESEKRKKVRKSINIPSFYGFEDEMERGTILDISEGGLFLATQRLLKTGAYLELKFLLPNSERPIKVWGRVVWLNEEGNKKKPAYPTGMGIEFVSLTKELRKIIKEFIERL